MEFVAYLTRVIILQDPTRSCHRRGTRLSWQGLPVSKSLFHSPEGCGLPIGNLTSQLFSNVYLNELDQWMKRQMGCRRYGRYVSNATLGRMERKVPLLSRQREPRLLCSSLNSFLGLLSHYRCYHVRRRMFLPLASAWKYGYFLRGVCKYVLKPEYLTLYHAKAIIQRF